VNQVISDITNEQQHQREHTHFAKITENAKGEPSVTVSIMGDDEYEVHDQVIMNSHS
jgi:alpha-mannosidase